MVASLAGEVKKMISNKSCDNYKGQGTVTFELQLYLLKRDHWPSYLLGEIIRVMRLLGQEKKYFFSLVLKTQWKIPAGCGLAVECRQETKRSQV